jgi:hypothetical protein
MFLFFSISGISDRMYKVAAKLAIVCDRCIIDGDDLEDSKILALPSIIIFLPGIYEIERMETELLGIKDKFE